MRLTGYRLLPLSVTALLLAACSHSNVVSKPVVEATAVVTAPSAPSMPSPVMMGASRDKMMVESKGGYYPMPPIMPTWNENRENYQDKQANPIHQTVKDAIATFSIDTDTGSYANVRRMLNNGQLPPTDAVRTEELINYFNYNFNQARKLGNAPFLVDTETVVSPWQPTNRIIKVAIKAEDSLVKANQALPPANLVFLVDVSGSMSDKDKLPLAKSALKMLTQQPTARCDALRQGARSNQQNSLLRHIG